MLPIPLVLRIQLALPRAVPVAVRARGVFATAFLQTKGHDAPSLLTKEHHVEVLVILTLDQFGTQCSLLHSVCSCEWTKFSAQRIFALIAAIFLEITDLF